MLRIVHKTNKGSCTRPQYTNMLDTTTCKEVCAVGTMGPVPGNIIWQLPGDVIGSIITENLNLQNISRFDVACSANKERTLYFGALRAGGRLSEVNAGSEVLDWVIKRSVKVGRLKVQSATAVACISKVVASQKLFETVELDAMSWEEEPSALQSALALLSRMGQKVSVISIRRSAGDGPFPDEVRFKNLHTCAVDCHTDTSEWIAKVINQNTSLKDVKIAAREALSASVFAALLARRSTLRDLTLLVRDELMDALFDQVAVSCPNLRTLKIGGVGDDYTFAAKTISQGVVSLAQGCPDLRELRVVNCVLSDDDANRAMLHGLRNLRVLDVLDANMLLSDAVLQTLAECRSDAPFLTELEIMWNVQRTDTVAQGSVVFANLHRLVLHTAYPPPPVDALLAGLAQLSRLEDLTLKVPGLWISELVAVVAQGSPNLRNILVDCGWQDSAEAGLVKVAQHCPLLETIHTVGGTISAVVVQALAQHCPRFRALSGQDARCPVSTVDLLALVQGCPLLTTLDLQVGPALNDAVVQALAQHSYYLEKLRLPSGVRISEEALVQLVTSCKYLNTLWCPKAAMDPTFERQLRQLSRARGRKLEILHR
jgi:hypothetical protein